MREKLISITIILHLSVVYGCLSIIILNINRCYRFPTSVKIEFVLSPLFNCKCLKNGVCNRKDYFFWRFRCFIVSYYVHQRSINIPPIAIGFKHLYVIPIVSCYRNSDYNIVTFTYF